MPPILILDGGLGTSLEQKHNVKFDSSTPLWSSDLLISDPDTLLACQKGFGDVPVDILLTATYQISLLGFAKSKSQSSPDGINRESIPIFLDKAVDIAEQAKGADARVALSIGPYGACMIPSQEYSGIYDPEYSSQDSLREWHAERLQLFANVKNIGQRTSYVALETIPRVDEIIAMRQALDSVPELAAIPFWMSSLFPGEDGRLPDGTPAEHAVQAMLDPNIAQSVPWGVGINCTKVWKLDSLLRRYETAIAGMLREKRIEKWPALVIYPDGTNGEVYNTTTQTWDVPDGADIDDRVPWHVQLADVVNETMARGQWRQVVVGGCCMASSDDIKRLRQTLVAN